MTLPYKKTLLLSFYKKQEHELNRHRNHSEAKKNDCDNLDKVIFNITKYPNCNQGHHYENSNERHQFKYHA